MGKINNVMSIDCDVFVRGHTYAKYINHDLSAELNWDLIELIKQEVTTIDLELDEDYLNKAIELIRLKCTNAKIELITEHDEIVSVMKKHNCRNTTMYNLDAHHDISYLGDNTELNLENWVLHARDKKLIKDYHWINRELSDPCECSTIIHTRTTLTDLDINKINKIDLLVICTSKHFTPKQYWDSIPKLLNKGR